MFWEWLWVVVEFFEVLGDCSRWFYVVVGIF